MLIIIIITIVTTIVLVLVLVLILETLGLASYNESNETHNFSLDSFDPRNKTFHSCEHSRTVSAEKPQFSLGKRAIQKSFLSGIAKKGRGSIPARIR